jgi:exodeoxyribonuclease V alpha subunit
VLQQALAPYRDGVLERRHGARVFRVGDKVIQTRNNYDKGTAGVFNGTVGTVTALSIQDRRLTVRSDEDEDIDYDFDELDELQHAYAITVHRSQGSEYPAVVVPLTMNSDTLLQRNLLYTAVTRAKRLVLLVGSRKALAIARTHRAGTGRRHTALTHRFWRRRAGSRRATHPNRWTVR